ncbi:hypothetical protein [Paenibacillus sp. HB172176]|uniref:hypothetical protein n=1 Tax=Paenibacillus sp. HB172176 TaxID=2493690 RepID=UPI00143C18B3|nr:hypothetical protein [Paenibacillus sp. HB172176]
MHSRRQVEEIWLMDTRISRLYEQYVEALVDGKEELAACIERKCRKLKQEMLDKYDVIV